MKKRVIALFFIVLGGFVYAQQPTHSPSPQNNTPINLNNWFDVVVFIVLPIVLFVLYFFWRKNVRIDKDNPKNEED